LWCQSLVIGTSSLSRWKVPKDLRSKATADHYPWVLQKPIHGLSSVDRINELAKVAQLLIGWRSEEASTLKRDAEPTVAEQALDALTEGRYLDGVFSSPDARLVRSVCELNERFENNVSVNHHSSNTSGKNRKPASGMCASGTLADGSTFPYWSRG
jgi:hypothetical protein